MSSYQKRYETALESAKGGVNIVTGAIMPQVIGAAGLAVVENGLLNTYNVASPFPLTLSFTNGTTNLTTAACLTAKLTMPEQNAGGANNWTAAGCTADMESTNIINPTTGVTVADMSFVLPGPTAAQNFVVYAKIVDTTLGNTSTSGLDLQGSGVVESGSGMISPPQVPYMYRIEFLSERQTNPDEKSQLSVLYAY